MAHEVVELFAGGGGLAMGLAAAGFRHVALVDSDRFACETLRLNATQAGWDPDTVQEGDAGRMVFDRWRGAAVLAAGVPCQPFSQSGLANGHEDARNLFPVLFRAIRELQPR